jgi:hypothetical protein
MSLIHTCELNGVNSFDYLTALQKHADELCVHPADWIGNRHVKGTHVGVELGPT